MQYRLSSFLTVLNKKCNYADLIRLIATVLFYSTSGFEHP
jgi:hypothetical protein